MISNYIDYNLISENLSINQETKEIYGEINTPFFFIENMLNLLPHQVFEDPEQVWLDPGSGSGNFSIVLYFRLMKSLKIMDPKERSNHIIQKMMYMCEINEENVEKLKYLFGNDANIFSCDFLELKESDFPKLPSIIIGNPPFNMHGSIKVPTNNEKSKKKDGQNGWIPFINKSINLLRQNGYLNVIIPSIWMKPDKEKMYNKLIQYNIFHLHTLSNSETNKLFSYGAQTPTCYFVLQKSKSSNTLSIYDNIQRDYIKIDLKENMPIALNGWSILQKILPFCEKYGNLYNTIIKTNMPKKDTYLSDNYFENSYSNVHSCCLNDNIPYLKIKYSSEPLKFYNEKKIILAHKMYGFSYLDIKGDYGISNRDNYIIKDKSDEELYKLQYGFNNKIIFFIMTTTRYRMKYLEKYAFYYIPDFSKMINVYDDFFSKLDNILSKEEYNLINNVIKNNYEYF